MKLRLLALLTAILLIAGLTGCSEGDTTASSSPGDGASLPENVLETVSDTGDTGEETPSLETVASDFTPSSSSAEQPAVTEQREKVAYLTFDDGPSEMTPRVLDVLKEYGVRATFFVVHTDDEVCISYMKRAADEGHEIAVHSYTHSYNLVYQSVDSFFQDFEQTRQWVKSITGKEVDQFRFPGGSSNSYVKKADLSEILYRMAAMHCVHHDWNVSSGDAAPSMLSKEQILGNVLDNAVKFNEAVILMHDIERNVSTLEVLPEIITVLRENGYTFNTVSNVSKPAQHRTYQ